MKSTKVVMSVRPMDADVFTHAGTFHADDVMATAIIAEMHPANTLTVHRTVSMDGIDLGPTNIVYDIGHGQYDHHQKGGNGARENGIPYSSVGLIWRDFGMRICRFYAADNAELVWKMVDTSLIQGIDAINTGVYPMTDFPCHAMTFSGVISGFNPN